MPNETSVLLKPASVFQETDLFIVLHSTDQPKVDPRDILSMIVGDRAAPPIPMKEVYPLPG